MRSVSIEFCLISVYLTMISFLNRLLGEERENNEEENEEEIEVGKKQNDRENEEVKKLEKKTKWDIAYTRKRKNNEKKKKKKSELAPELQNKQFSSSNEFKISKICQSWLGFERLTSRLTAQETDF